MTDVICFITLFAVESFVEGRITNTLVGQFRNSDTSTVIYTLVFLAHVITCNEHREGKRKNRVMVRIEENFSS